MEEKNFVESARNTGIIFKKQIKSCSMNTVSEILQRPWHNPLRGPLW